MARRLSPLVLVLSLVFVPPLLGSPNRPRNEVLRAPRQTAAWAELAGGVWQHLTSLWATAGCIIDPNGARCVASPTSPTGGTLVAQPPAPAGCILDPNGCR